MCVCEWEEKVEMRKGKLSGEGERGQRGQLQSLTVVNLKVIRIWIKVETVDKEDIKVNDIIEAESTNFNSWVVKSKGEKE